MMKGIVGSAVVLMLCAAWAEAQPIAPFPPPWQAPAWAPPPPWAPPPAYFGPRYGYPPMPPPMGMPCYMPGCPCPQPYLPPCPRPCPTYPPAPSCPPAPQPPPVPPYVEPPAPCATAGGASSCCDTGQSGPILGDICGPTRCGPRGWLVPEYLYWIAKPGPLSIPLVTSGSSADPIPSALGQPGTKVLFGGNNINYPGTNGFRASGGLWFDPESRIGIDVSAFILENAVVHFSAVNNGTNANVLALPFFNPNTAQQEAFVIAGTAPPSFSQPLGTTLQPGSVSIVSASQLYGGEVNGAFNLTRAGGFDVDFLAGARYLNLQESLNLTANFNDIPSGGTTYTTINDGFATSNQFYGGQLGIRASYLWGALYSSVTLKGAAGINSEMLNVTGSTSQNVAGVATTSPGGFYAEPTNIGQHNSNVFSVVPQVSGRIGWQLVPGIRLFAGYDFLYWYNVVRPGNQLNANINTTQSLGGTLTGLAVPAKMFNQTNYFIQGVTVGVEFVY